MAVTQRTLKKSDYSMQLAQVGAWLILAAVGGLFFAVNGGYSVIGLEVVSHRFNGAGAIFWTLISSWQVELPHGLPAQPVLPWLLVIGSSLLQVALVWRKLSGREIPAWMVWLGLATTAYDLGSTYFGLGTVTWVAQAGWLLQMPLTGLFTFGLEAIIGYLLRRR